MQITEFQQIMERPLQTYRTAAAAAVSEWAGVSNVLKPGVMTARKLLLQRQHSFIYVK